MQEPQRQRTTAQVKRSLSQHGFTGQQRLGYPFGNPDCPVVVIIVAIREHDEKTCVGDGLHLRENPLRLERSVGPATAPAKRRNGRPVESLAFSSWSRMMRPLGNPVSRAAWSSHSASSSGNRTVIGLLISRKCNPPAELSDRNADHGPFDPPRAELYVDDAGRGVLRHAELDAVSVA